jgi:transcriptional regulator EpsA
LKTKGTDRRVGDRRGGLVPQLLEPDEVSAFMDVVEASLSVTRREQLFIWLQRSCQYLLPHEILLCGIQEGKGRQYQFEMFTCTRYMGDAQLQAATAPDGIVTAAVSAWRQSQRPVLLAEGMNPGDYGQYVVPVPPDPQAIQRSEMRNMAAHGIGLREDGVSTFFCFGRLSGELDAKKSYILELLAPYLHTMFTRISGPRFLAKSDAYSDNPVTPRELEILEWAHKGKTNWEIAGILDISPLTVKNHMQNILRKLDVQNRSHAALKATQLGLVRV